MNDDPVADFCARHRWTGAPERLMARLCDELLEEAGCSAPVDVRLLASFRRARIEEAEQAHAGLLIPGDRGLVIRVRASDSEERRRFTVCHEICHTFLPGYQEAIETRADLDVERFDPRDPEEYLCDVGAAELLLPRRDMIPLLHAEFALDDVIALAATFRASIEATGLRCVDLSSQPVAFIVLERTPLGSGRQGLYARRSRSNGLPPIKPSTLIPDHLPLARAIDEPELAYHGDTGVFQEACVLYARSMPYERAGQKVERAIALVRPATSGPPQA